MLSLSHLYIAAHQTEMLNLAANERLARKLPKTSTPNRLVATINSFWSLLSGPAELPVTPTLYNYPFRG